MIPDATVVIASYPARHRADIVAEELRGHKIPASVIASAERAGAWDVVVRPNYAERAKALMKSPQDS
ncbi:MAG TPA: hypothetical protein VFH48_27615 [Chloroflexota bacterium]|nr:hypothetical protein [Chloroflexota bacterium]